MTFPFLDFGTLKLREFYCREELRCNSLFASELYDAVVPVSLGDDGSPVMGGEGEVVEWALRMKQFDHQAQLDLLLEAGQVTPKLLSGFGRSLAKRHAGLPRLEEEAGAVVTRILGPPEDNFTSILDTSLADRHGSLLEETRELTRRAADRLKPLMERRMTGGFVRDCHGDLHLSNLALIDDVVTAFDCLEFNANLRWIDMMSDVAFLHMDCHVRDRADLAYAFLDGYLDESGDYDGARLLGFFGAYRSMVRAKVAALRFEQDRSESAADRCLMHLGWTHAWLKRPPGRLVLTCGLSGSGKSWMAERMVGRLRAARLRSDVARKHLAGLATAARSGAELDGGLYGRAHTEEVFSYLEDCAAGLLACGENVILDATFLESSRRQQMLQMASAQGAHACIVQCEAPAELLRERVREREAEGRDASEATVEVLERQFDRFEPPDAKEPVMVVYTGREWTHKGLDKLAAEILRD